MNVSQWPDPPINSSSAGSGGISVKQRLGVGALAPTNPKTGLPPIQVIKPLPKSHPSWAGLKIKKITPLPISTDVNPASGREPSLGSAYDSSMHSADPTSKVSPNITHLTLSTSVPPNFYQHVTPNETM